MIGFAIPWVFGIAVAAALAITALHLLSVRQPRTLLLPTARFIPERTARAVSRQAKPNDVALLLLRVIALLAAGAALAGARCGTRGAGVSSIIVIDRTLRADSSTLVSRVAAATSGGDLTNPLPPTVLWVHGVSDDPGVAIAAGIRESARQAQGNASLVQLSLTVVMPDVVRSRRGWDAWRSQWPARIRLVPAGRAVSDTTATAAMAARTVRVLRADMSPGMDAVDAAFASRGARAPQADAPDVIVHRANTAERTSGENGARVTVFWPVSGVPIGWRTAPGRDSVDAVVAEGLALVAPWVRTALPPETSDSLRAIAWWSDGVVAAVERTRGVSCVREVAIAVAERSDLLLSASADGLFRALRAPCGGRAVPAPREPLGTAGGVSGVPAAGAYAEASRFRALGATARRKQPAWLAAVLLALAAVALLAEQVVRRGFTGRAAS